MKEFRVSVMKGGMNAPFLTVNAKDNATAEAEARKASGLGKYEDWNFVAQEIKQKPTKKGKRKATA